MRTGDKTCLERKLKLKSWRGKELLKTNKNQRVCSGKATGKCFSFIFAWLYYYECFVWLFIRFPLVHFRPSSRFFFIVLWWPRSSSSKVKSISVQFWFISSHFQDLNRLIFVNFASGRKPMRRKYLPESDFGRNFLSPVGGWYFDSCGQSAVFLRFFFPRSNQRRRGQQQSGWHWPLWTRLEEVQLSHFFLSVFLPFFFMMFLLIGAYRMQLNVRKTIKRLIKMAVN